MTKYIKDNISSLCGTMSAKTPGEFNSVDGCTPSDEVFNIKKIYVLKGLDDLGDNAKKFDAYMIDYLRKLDVNESDELIIVEYRRPVLKTNGEQKKDSLGNGLYETYIASLEW